MTNDRDRETVEAIRAHIAEKGFPPSVRQLAARLGLSSADSAHKRLVAAEAAGLIVRGDGARALRLVETE